jgi:hypothetical protein
MEAPALAWGILSILYHAIRKNGKTPGIRRFSKGRRGSGFRIQGSEIHYKTKSQTINPEL